MLANLWESWDPRLPERQTSEFSHLGIECSPSDICKGFNDIKLVKVLRAFRAKPLVDTIIVTTPMRKGYAANVIILVLHINA
ncbi:hypothetical protein Tco_0348040 [Tanacetum coccineum]